MNGSILKITGGVMILIGALALLGGLVAAGYGGIDESENRDQFVSDPERSEINEALIMYGLVGAGIGLVVLIIGLILLSMGNSAANQAMIAAAASGDASLLHGRTPVVAGVVLGVLVLGGLIAWLAIADPSDPGNGQGNGFFNSHGEEDILLDEQSFEGRVQQAYSHPLESGTMDSTESTQEFDAPAGTGHIEGNLTWTPQQGGTDQLRIVIEMESNGEWIELDRANGQGPLEFSATDADLDNAHLRFRVFPDADASVVQEQAFEVTVRFHAGP